MSSWNLTKLYIQQRAEKEERLMKSGSRVLGVDIAIRDYCLMLESRIAKIESIKQSGDATGGGV